MKLIPLVTSFFAGQSAAFALSPIASKIGSKKDQHIQEDTYFVGEKGYYLKIWNTTIPQKEANQFAKKLKAHLPITVINPSNQSMCLQAGYTQLNQPVQVTHRISYNESENHRVYMAANSTLQFGNYVPRGDRVHYNGRVQAWFGCNASCTECPGDNKVRHTLVEWKYGNDSGDPIYSAEAWWTNLSNGLYSPLYEPTSNINENTVDGLSHNTNVTIFDNKGKDCHYSRNCNVTMAEMKKSCPPERFWEADGAHGCTSDCQATGESKYCCTGDFAPRVPHGTCPKSSSYLKQLCPDAYSSPYDDDGNVSNCYKSSGARIVFSAIV